MTGVGGVLEYSETIMEEKEHAKCWHVSTFYAKGLVVLALDSLLLVQGAGHRQDPTR